MKKIMHEAVMTIGYVAVGALRLLIEAVVLLISLVTFPPFSLYIISQGSLKSDVAYWVLIIGCTIWCTFIAAVLINSLYEYGKNS